MKKAKVLLIMLSMVSLCGCGAPAASTTNNNVNEGTVTEVANDDVSGAVDTDETNDDANEVVDVDVVNDDANEAVDIEVTEDETDTQEEIGDELANPWIDSDEQKTLEATGFDLVCPEGATDVAYSYMEETKLAQLAYNLDGIDWTYRVQAATEMQDISGMNYEWISVSDGTVAGKSAVYMGYSDADENADTIDGVNYVQVVNWYDDVAGVIYSLSACGENVNGMDIQVYAENIYVPLQGETDAE